MGNSCYLQIDADDRSFMTLCLVKVVFLRQKEYNEEISWKWYVLER